MRGTERVVRWGRQCGHTAAGVWATNQAFANGVFAIGALAKGFDKAIQLRQQFRTPDSHGKLNLPNSRRKKLTY